MHINSFPLVIGQQWFLFKTLISHLTERTRTRQEMGYLGDSPGGWRSPGSIFWGSGFLQSKNELLFIS